MGPLTIIYLLYNFHNSNSWIIAFFFFGGPSSFELDKFDCISINTTIHLHLGPSRDYKVQPPCAFMVCMGQIYLY
jgi:hypothetical protein